MSAIKEMLASIDAYLSQHKSAMITSVVADDGRIYVEIEEKVGAQTNVSMFKVNL